MGAVRRTRRTGFARAILNMEAARLKIVICWTEISGYMNACWKALARRPGIDLQIGRAHV